MSGFDVATQNLIQNSRNRNLMATPRDLGDTAGEKRGDMMLSAAFSIIQTSSKMANAEAQKLKAVIKAESKTHTEYQTRVENEINPILKYSMLGDPLGAYDIKSTTPKEATIMKANEETRLQNLGQKLALQEMSFAASHTQNYDAFLKEANRIEDQLRSKQDLNPDWGMNKKSIQDKAKLYFENKKVGGLRINESDIKKSVLIDSFNNFVSGEATEKDILEIPGKIEKELGRNLSIREKNLIYKEIVGNISDLKLGQEIIDKAVSEKVITPGEKDKLLDTLAKNYASSKRSSTVIDKDRDNWIESETLKGEFPPINPNIINNKGLQEYVRYGQNNDSKLVEQYGAGPLRFAAQSGLETNPLISQGLRNTATSLYSKYNEDWVSAVLANNEIPSLEKENLSLKKQLTTPQIDPETGQVIPSTLMQFHQDLALMANSFYDINSRLLGNDPRINQIAPKAQVREINAYYSILPTSKAKFDFLNEIYDDINSTKEGSKNRNLFFYAADIAGDPDAGIFLQVEKTFGGGENSFEFFDDLRTNKKNQTKNLRDLYERAIRAELGGAPSLDERKIQGFTALLAANNPREAFTKDLGERLETAIKKGEISSTYRKQVREYFRTPHSSYLQGLILPGNKLIRNAEGSLVNQLQQFKISRDPKSPSLVQALREGYKLPGDFAYSVVNAGNSLDTFSILKINKKTGKASKITDVKLSSGGHVLQPYSVFSPNVEGLIPR